MAVKLYDLGTSNYPHRDGARFRVKQVYRCVDCGSLTNRAVYRRSKWGSGPRVMCSCAAECWHHEIQEKRQMLEKSFPASLKRELWAEIEAICRRHPPHDDVVGPADRRQLKPMGGGRSIVTKTDASCRHVLGLLSF